MAGPKLLQLDFSQLLQQLKSGDQSPLLHIYKTYRDEFLTYANKNFALPTESGKDIFQSVIIDFYQNVMDDKLIELTSSLKTYLFALGRYKIINEKKRDNLSVTYKRLQLIKNLENANTIDEKENSNHYQYWKEKYLRLCCERCKEILELYYISQLSMQEIATKLRYKNAAVVKKKKYECLQKIIKCAKLKKENFGKLTG